jgi:hypothetical protein
MKGKWKARYLQGPRSKYAKLRPRGKYIRGCVHKGRVCVLCIKKRGDSRAFCCAFLTTRVPQLKAIPHTIAASSEALPTHLLYSL